MSEFKIIFTFLGMIPILFSLYLLFIWFWLQKWPVTTGTVKGARVEKMLGTKHGGGNGMGMSSSFKAYVRYEYVVDGKIYSSKNIKVGLLTFSGPFWAESYVSRYRVHNNVDVYYNPKFPKMSYLEKDIGIGVWTSMLGGILFVFAGQMV